MLRTWEVRWFFRVEVPLGAGLGLGGLDRSDWRRDWYATPVNPACGIKLREGQLQPKLLERDRGLQSLGPVRGRVQQWAKWSLAMPESDAPDESLLAGTGWLAVDKRRVLRYYRCDPDGITAVDDIEEADCQVEWTQVRLAGETWWTLGFEAFPGAYGEAVLRRVAESVLSDSHGSGQLNESRCQAYPAWLVERCR